MISSYLEYGDRLPGPAFAAYLTDLVDLEGRADFGEILVAERDGAMAGTATFTASKPTVTGSPCTLVAATASTSTCTVTWAPNTTGNQTIKAKYTSSDLAKWASAGNSTNFTVAVTP